jgi:surface protein
MTKKINRKKYDKTLKKRMMRRKISNKKRLRRKKIGTIMRGGATIITDDNIHKLIHCYIHKKTLLPDDLIKIPIGQWDVSRVTNMARLFYDADADAHSFNEDIGGWNVSNVTTMRNMFEGAHAFNHPVGKWNVSQVKNMANLFYDARSFNQPIGGWNVSNVTNMNGMFQNAQAFNRPIGGWNVSKVTTMRSMFENAQTFNQPIGEWKVSNVKYMQSMFENAHAFNQPIGEWDVSKVTDMSGMFDNAHAFNEPIDEWDVSSEAVDWRRGWDARLQSRVFTGPEPVKHMCGERGLFQRPFKDDLFSKWTPLPCLGPGRGNCTPTGFRAVFSDMDVKPFQQLSDKVTATAANTGTPLIEGNKFLYDLVKHLKLEPTVMQVREFLPHFLNFFRTNLFPGNITVIHVLNEVNPASTAPSHTTTVARFKPEEPKYDGSGKVVTNLPATRDRLAIFDGQVSRLYYEGEDMLAYLRMYEHVVVFCSEHKHKQQRRDETTMPQSPRSSSSATARPAVTHGRRHLKGKRRVTHRPLVTPPLPPLPLLAPMPLPPLPPLPQIWSGSLACTLDGAPGTIAFDGEGNLAVSDFKNHCIQVFHAFDRRRILRTIGIYGAGGPWGIAFDGAGHIIVSERDGHRVQVLRYIDGAHVRTIGSKGSGNGQFKYPTGIAVDGEGNVAVYDNYNARVQVHRLSDGAYIRTIGSRGSGIGQFERGYGSVAFDSEGNLVVADGDNHRVQVLRYSDGTHLRTIGSEGGGAGQFDHPSGVAFDTEDKGHIFVSDSDNRRVQMLRYSDGSLVNTINLTDRPGGIAITPTGNLAVVVSKSVHIFILPDLSRDITLPTPSQVALSPPSQIAPSRLA